MRPPRFVLIATSVVLFAAFMASACGGQSFSSSPGTSAGTAGTSAEGGSSSAGKASSGGSTGKAGEAFGGKTSGGGSTTAGAGGRAPDDACSGPPEGGASTCNGMARPYWTYDTDIHLCRPILFSGCGGTRNLYATLDECQAACASTDSFDACETPTDCVLGNPGCCGVCDGPDVTAHDFIVYNRSYAGKVSTCGDVACGACPNPTGDGTRRYFLPDCVKGRCVVQDLRTSSLSACKEDSDCRLRHGTGCCESCGSGLDDVVAVRSDGSFEDFVCGGLALPCPACAPQPVAANVLCSAGHCAYSSDN